MYITAVARAPCASEVQYQERIGNSVSLRCDQDLRNLKNSNRVPRSEREAESLL